MATIWEVPDNLCEQFHSVILELDLPRATGRKRVHPRRILDGRSFRMRTGRHWNRLPRVLADRLRIAQALGNLLSNAARHSAESSTIRGSAQLEGVHVTLTVADDGVGIAPERLPCLFRRFSRAEGKDVDGVGAGLGLAICRGIVEAHGGQIWAESDGPGMGAKLTFTLPATTETDTLLPRSLGCSAGWGRQRVRVLAVDDAPQSLRYLRDTLAETGYAVAVAGEPEEAL